MRSLKIDRAPAPSAANNNRTPKLLLLGICGTRRARGGRFIFLFTGTKTISAAPVRVESAGGAAPGTSILSATGYVVAHHKIAVGAKVMGRVAWIGVEKGDLVQEGQVLVRLEDTEFRAQVNQATRKSRVRPGASRSVAQRLASAGKMRDRAAVLQAEARLRTAEAEYQRTERLYRDGVASKSELDRTLSERDTAAALLEAAKQSSTMTDIGPRPEEIRAAAAEVQQMKAALDYAQTQLAATEIKAPVSGTVLERIVERGEMVSPSAFGGSGARTSVVDLADLTDLQVELDISQTDFSRLKMDQRAEIIPEAYPNLKYTVTSRRSHRRRTARSRRFRSRSS